MQALMATKAGKALSTSGVSNQILHMVVLVLVLVLVSVMDACTSTQPESLSNRSAEKGG